MNDYSYEDIYVGQTASFDVTISEEMLDGFRALTGDTNPLHVDDEFAAAKGHPGKVCFGMLTASFLSTLAGVYLPGRNALIQMVNVKFANPVYVGDCLDVTGIVNEKQDTVSRIVLKVRILRGEDTVLRGEMVVGFS
jgi:3-hydroxybutyryl-CoA dehydratase